MRGFFKQCLEIYVFMKKTFSVLFVTLLLGMASTGVAQPVDQSPSGPEQAPEKPGSNTTAGPIGNLPDLPGQASDTARQVVDTIGSAFSDGVQGVGQSLGGALSSLLGGGEDSGTDSDVNGTEQA